MILSPADFIKITVSKMSSSYKRDIIGTLVNFFNDINENIIDLNKKMDTDNNNEKCN